MRTGKITLDGEEHLLCYSLQVAENVLEKSKENMSELQETVWLLAEMMQAGDKYAKYKGIANTKPLTMEEMYNILGIEDLKMMNFSIEDAMQKGTERAVETKETTKNG